MCCEPKSHFPNPGSMVRKMIAMHIGDSGCCDPSLRRRYYTKEEKVKMLEELKETLEKEIAGVKEEIENLSGK